MKVVGTIVLMFCLTSCSTDRRNPAPGLDIVRRETKDGKLLYYGKKGQAINPFKRIKKGMSPSEVEAVLGEPTAVFEHDHYFYPYQHGFVVEWSYPNSEYVRAVWRLTDAKGFQPFASVGDGSTFNPSHSINNDMHTEQNSPTEAGQR